MRVLIDYRPALRDPSGVGEATRQLVKAMAARFPAGAPDAVDLTLFSSSWKDRLTPPADVPGAAAIDRRVPVRLLNVAWHRLGWPSAERLTGAAFDVVHSPHPLLLPARRAAQVITIHDLHFLDRPERTQAEIRRDYPALVRRHARRAHCILTPSRYTAADVERRLGVPADRIVVCPHGAPDWPARPAPPHDGYVLFMGTLEPRKNIGGLLDAYERLLARRDAPPPPALVLAGQSGPEASTWLGRIARRPLAGHVRYAGYVQPTARYDLYAGARALVLPSFDEGFGLPVVEAMRVGVPVITSTRGALPEVVGDAGPMVDPDDPAALAAALARVLEEPGFADACAARGAARVRRFSWQRTAELVRDGYDRAVEQHRRRSGR